jgi:Sulfotransferase domain
LGNASTSRCLNHVEIARTDQPTIFHITHWKAGSQWIHRMLHNLCYHRLVLPRVDRGQFLAEPIVAGKIYPTLYVTKEEFESVKIPHNSYRFVIIRDLRDTLVSFTFSVLFSHAPEHRGTEELLKLRNEFRNADLEDTMLHIMHGWLTQCAAIQASWIASGEPFIKYNDLLENDVSLLVDLFVNRAPLNIPKVKLVEVIKANRFEVLTGGRKRGVEDVSSHERKGIAGDWKNYFTDRISREFDSIYGDLLIQTGFEVNHDWAIGRHD